MPQAESGNTIEHPAVATARVKAKMEAAIEKLLSALDALDAPEEDKEPDDADEENGDLEPSLAFPGAASGTNGTYHHGNSEDLEDNDDSGIGDLDGLTEQTNGEPDLGSFDRMLDQTKSYRQRELFTHVWPDAEQDDADAEDGDTGIADDGGLMEQTGAAR